MHLVQQVDIQLKDLLRNSFNYYIKKNASTFSQIEYNYLTIIKISFLCGKGI